MKKCFIFAALFLTACPWDKTPLCDAQKNVSSKFAAAIGTSFGCKKTDVVEADLNKALEPLKLCEPKAAEVGTTGVLADLVCPPMVKYAIGQGVNLLPKEWECAGGTASDTLEVTLTDLCKKIPY